MKVKLNKIGVVSIVLVLVVVFTSVIFIIYKSNNKQIVEDIDYNNATSNLINENATEEAKKLMNYLKGIYGKKVLTGQYVNEYDDFSLPQYRIDPNDDKSPSTVFKSNELQAVHSVTGKYPAVIGLDVSGVEYDAKCFTVEQAIEWHNNGGIVTICWHWNVDNFDGKGRAFYTEDTKFNLKKALKDKNSEQYQGLIKDIDAVSQQLKILQDNGVPVLWRPLHEASGGWFWWGASGADAYKELWNIVYDRMTNYHKLNNLIWVYNGQNPKWYVGDDKCDIVADDPYFNKNRKHYLKDSANVKRFKQNVKTSTNKMIAMSENDFVPNIDTMFETNAKWLFFSTWCREFVCVYEEDKDGNKSITPEYSEMCSTKEELKAAYENENAITLDELNIYK